ncbi:hypothetical protein [Mesorhizobium sp. M0701]|uniref:hypothetical protein n=1 Tax=unclassified Mesorhizobium TaxID=325217 RepID=UPI00333D88E5
MSGDVTGEVRVLSADPSRQLDIFPQQPVYARLVKVLEVTSISFQLIVKYRFRMKLRQSGPDPFFAVQPFKQRPDGKKVQVNEHVQMNIAIACSKGLFENQADIVAPVDFEDAFPDAAKAMSRHECIEILTRFANGQRQGSTPSLLRIVPC